MTSSGPPVPPAVDWLETLRLLGIALAGGGGLGAALTFLARLFPSGDRRLSDMAAQRKERADRVRELEAQLDALRREYDQALDDCRAAIYAEKERTLQALRRLLAAEGALERLSAKLGLPAMVTAAEADAYNEAVRPEMAASLARYQAGQPLPKPPVGPPA